MSNIGNINFRDVKQLNLGEVTRVVNPDNSYYYIRTLTITGSDNLDVTLSFSSETDYKLGMQVLG